MITNNLFTVWRKREANLGQRLTYATVSDATGISQATLSRWMTGKARQFDAGTIETLCGFFDCEVSDLIVQTDPSGEAEVDDPEEEVSS